MQAPGLPFRLHIYMAEFYQFWLSDDRSREHRAKP